MHCSHFSPREQKQIREGSNNGEGEHGRAATGEMKYFTLSPGFPPSSRVFCSFPPVFRGLCTAAAHASPERAHATHTRQRGEDKKKKKRGKKKGRRNKIGDVFECVFAPTLFPLSLLGGRKRGDTGAECDVTLLPRPFIRRDSR